MSVVDASRADHGVRPLLAGAGSGLFVTGAISALLVQLVPGPQLPHGPAAAALAGAAIAWGLLCVLWMRMPTPPFWVSDVSVVLGVVLVAGVAASTGGVASPVRFYLYFIVVFAASFYGPRALLACLVTCSAVAAMPLVYDSNALDEGLLRELVVVIPSFFALGGSISWATRVFTRLREAAETAEASQRRYADEQAALRRVATLVATAAVPEDVYRLVAREAARFERADAAGLLRLESRSTARLVGKWTSDDEPAVAELETIAIPPRSDFDRVVDTRRPVRIDSHSDKSPLTAIGYRCSVLTPVVVDDRMWGILALATRDAHGLPDGTEDRMARFSELLAASVSNTEHRTLLAQQAMADPLTGLLNHRCFHERLAEEVARAQRHNLALSIAVIDVDHFKEVNDNAGHEAGDRVLMEIADRMRASARVEDVVARIGGDEFALILPETPRMNAMSAIERLRADVSSRQLGPRRVTISAGICELEPGRDAEEMFRLADGALYWSKAHGRDVAWVYDPSVVRELSVHERADQLQRTQAMTGLRALARAIDARDSSTRRHSERVAVLAEALAEVRGWTPERVAMLRDAALIHDVGKIGIPDSILLKADSLTSEEYEIVKRHAALGAQIASEVLGPEQVLWIGSHHERPDGLGYPDALTGERISEGAGLLALADAWDVMTLSRTYSIPKSLWFAVAECESLAGRQFMPQAVDALVELHESRKLVALASSLDPADP